MINKINFAKNYQLAILITLSFFAFYYVASTITGIVLNYTPVPYWDMWESVFLYSDIYHGHWPVLFSYYGEHPIALANILYLMDAFLFGARGIFLLSMSLLANSLIIIIFYKIISKSIPSSRYIPYFISVVTCIMFSWMQTDNFNFPFQVEFFLVELVPLIAFYGLYKAKIDKSSFYTGVAIIFGLLSFETMAAGIFTFPVLVLMACLFRMKKSLIATLGALSVAILTFYLLTRHISTYTPAAKFGSISHIIQVIKGFFTIWKYPFDYITSHNYINYCFAIIPIATFIYGIYRWTKYPETCETIQLVTLAFLGYLLLMSLSIVYGRLNYSLTTSRYTTPILMGYAATLVFWAPAIVRVWKKMQPRPSIVLLLIPLFLLTTQADTYMKPVEPFNSHNSSSTNVNFRHMQKVALLANILQIRDTDQESSHFAATIIGIKDHYPLFNIEPFNDAIKIFGTIDTSIVSTQCIGNLETIESIPSDSNNAFMRVSGWIFNPLEDKIPKALRIEDENHRVIGYAIAGGDRLDISLAYRKSKMKKSGYNGYILKEYAKKPLIAHSVFPDCTIALPAR